MKRAGVALLLAAAGLWLALGRQAPPPAITQPPSPNTRTWRSGLGGKR